MSVTARERNQPTQEELDDLLGMLLAANEAGELVSLAFMLQRPNGDSMVDYRGSQELTELATRTVRERIAHEVSTVHPKIAEQIRSDLARKVN